jgi:hypothetical protein
VFVLFEDNQQDHHHCKTPSQDKHYFEIPIEEKQWEK